MSRKPLLPGHRAPVDRFADRLRKRRHTLSPSLLKVAEYLDGNRHAVLGKSALDIGMELGTSDATVIRAVQALGFGGLVDLKETFQDYLGITASPSHKMAATTAHYVTGSDAAIDFVAADLANAMAALGSAENRAAMARGIEVLASARRIGVFGIGASGIIASYAARLFSRSGYPSYALNLTGIALAEQLLQMAEGDVVLMMAHGRKHREAAAVLAEAERLSVPLVMILTQDESPLGRQAAAVITMPRSKSGHVALHAPMLCCIEAMMLGLASIDSEKTVETLERLVELREIIRPPK